MTRQEINNIIKEKAEAYGFEADTNSRVYGIRQRNYISIQFFETSDLEKTDWENKIGWMNIEVKASICRMGGETTPEELLTAAEEIKRGAELVRELQELHLSYSEKF